MAVALPGIALVLAGCGTGTGPTTAPTAQGLPTSGPTPATLWLAPADPMGLAVAAGLEPKAQEHLDFHVHAHLDIFLDGKPVLVPAGIGINTADPEVKRFDDPRGVGYGGIQVCGQPCISPLHTHDPDGIIHTESAESTPNTLGEFFVEWDVELSATCVGEHCAPEAVAFYVDGLKYDGDPKAIQLTDRKEIAIVIGTPPPVIPAVADFSNA